MALEQPKKPVGGAYGVFMGEKRPEFSKLCVGKPMSALAKMAGEGWKKLSDAEKAPYQKKYDQAKAKYDVDIEAFTAAGGVKSKGVAGLRREKRKAKEAGGKGKKAKKDGNAPKRPAGGAFGCFLAANRAAFMKECPGAVTGVTKLASEKWKACPAADKLKFEKEYQDKKAAYDMAMKSYVPPAQAEDEIEDASEQDPTSPLADKKATKEAKKADALAAKEQRKADAAAKKDAKTAGKSAKLKTSARGKGKPVKPVEPELNIPKSVLDKAEKVGMADVLKKILGRPDIKEQDISASKALTALEEASGLLHKARHALLGA